MHIIVILTALCYISSLENLKDTIVTSYCAKLPILSKFDNPYCIVATFDLLTQLEIIQLSVALFDNFSFFSMIYEKIWPFLFCTLCGLDLIWTWVVRWCSPRLSGFTLLPLVGTWGSILIARKLLGVSLFEAIKHLFQDTSSFFYLHRAPCTVLG
jgi:hypothetical protein